MSEKKKSKSRTGCVTCKAKRLKCGEEKPECYQCTRRNIKCGGYKINYKWLPFAESNQAARIAKNNSASSSILSTSQNVTKKTPKKNQKKISLSKNIKISPTNNDNNTDKLILNNSTLPSIDSSNSISNLNKAEINNNLNNQNHDINNSSLNNSNILENNPTNANNDPLQDAFASAHAGIIGSLSSKTETSISSNTIDSNEKNILTEMNNYSLTTNSNLNSSQISNTIINPIVASSSYAEDKIETDFLDFLLNDSDIKNLEDTSNSFQTAFPLLTEDVTNSSLVTSSFIEDTTASNTDSKKNKFNLMNLFNAGYGPRMFSSSVPLPLYDLHETIFRNFNLYTSTILCVREDPNSYNPWREIIWPLASKSGALYHALAAMTGFHLGPESPNCKISIDSLDHMQRSLSALAHDISSNSHTPEITLATMLSLSFAESWDRSCISQVQTIRSSHSILADVLKAVRDRRKEKRRGKQRLITETSLSDFNAQSDDQRNQENMVYPLSEDFVGIDDPTTSLLNQNDNIVLPGSFSKAKIPVESSSFIDKNSFPQWKMHTNHSKTGSRTVYLRGEKIKLKGKIRFLYNSWLYIDVLSRISCEDISEVSDDLGIEDYTLASSDKLQSRSTSFGNPVDAEQDFQTHSDSSLNQQDSTHSLNEKIYEDVFESSSSDSDDNEDYCEKKFKNITDEEKLDFINIYDNTGRKRTPSMENENGVQINSKNSRRFSIEHTQEGNKAPNLDFFPNISASNFTTMFDDKGSLSPSFKTNKKHSEASSNFENVDALLGCAETLFPLIGKVAAIVRRVRESKKSTLSITSAAAELKQAIQDWSPNPSYKLNERGLELGACLATAEAYRYAALLHLHQAVPELVLNKPVLLSSDSTYDFIFSGLNKGQEFSASKDESESRDTEFDNIASSSKESISSSPLYTNYLETIHSMAEVIMMHIASIPTSSHSCTVHLFPLMVAGCECQPGEDRTWLKNRWTELHRRLGIGNVERAFEVIKEVWRRRDAMESDKHKCETRMGPVAVSMSWVNGRRVIRGSIHDSAHWLSVMRDWGWNIFLG